MSEFRTGDGREWGEVRTNATRIDRDLARQKAVEQVVAETFRPRLYRNKNKFGVVAILTPDTLKAAAANSSKFWRYNDLIFPPPKTFVFVTEEAEHAAKRRVGSFEYRQKVAGNMADLMELIMLYDAEVIEDERIYVPFVDESRVSYVTQLSAIDDALGVDLYRELVATQYPEPYRSRLLAL